LLFVFVTLTYLLTFFLKTGLTFMGHPACAELYVLSMHMTLANWFYFIILTFCVNFQPMANITARSTLLRLGRTDSVKLWSTRILLQLQ